MSFDLNIIIRAAVLILGQCLFSFFSQMQRLVVGSAYSSKYILYITCICKKDLRFKHGMT